MRTAAVFLDRIGTPLANEIASYLRNEIAPAPPTEAACTWTDGEQVFTGMHQFDNGKCSTCGVTEAQATGSKRYLLSEVEHLIKINDALVDALRNVVETFDRSKSAPTAASALGEIMVAIEPARAALRLAGEQ